MTDRPRWKRRWCAFQEWLADGTVTAVEIHYDAKRVDGEIEE